MVSVLGLCLAVSGAFAQHPGGLGIGVVGQYGYGYGGGIGGAALSLKIPSLPIFWGVNLGIGAHTFDIGLSGDKYIIDQSLTGSGDFNLGWYWGFGIGLGVGFGSWSDSYWEHSRFGFSVAGRMPIGLSFLFVKKVELFVGAVPQIGFAMDTWTGKWKGSGAEQTYSGDNYVGLGWNIGGELGLRFWL